MLVRSAMLPNPLVVSPETHVADFVDSVLNSNQTTAAVVEDGVLRGVISVHDIFTRILPPYVDMDHKLASVLHEGYFDEQFDRFERMTVGAIMTTEVDGVGPDDSVINVVALLTRHRRKTIPVIEDGKFIGVVTRRSILWKVRQGDSP